MGISDNNVFIIFIIIGCVDNEQLERSYLSDEIDLVRLYKRDAHYDVDVVISHDSSVPMIGHLQLAMAYKNPAVSCHEVR